MATYIRENESFTSYNENYYITFDEIGQITNEKCPINLLAKFSSSYPDELPYTLDYYLEGAFVSINWKGEDYLENIGYYFITLLWPELNLSGNYDYDFFTPAHSCGDMIKNKSYYLRIYLPDFESPCQFKLWFVEDEEPSEWCLLTPPSPTSPRYPLYPGYISYGIGYNESIISADFSYISVGTEGDDPISNEITLKSPVINNINTVNINPQKAKSFFSGNINFKTYIHEKFPKHLSAYNKFIKANHKRALIKQKIIRQPKRRG
ncbi:MAG: hypothetical protein ACQEQF_09535 [Bacillota bacterium]